MVDAYIYNYAGDKQGYMDVEKYYYNFCWET